MLRRRALARSGGLPLYHAHGDTGFLDAQYRIAGSDKTRSLYDTMKALIVYSGKISVGDHGMPILDAADWNDCLKLDLDWINGPEKERRYRAQLEETARAGARDSVRISARA